MTVLDKFASCCRLPHDGCDIYLIPLLLAVWGTCIWVLWKAVRRDFVDTTAD